MLIMGCDCNPIFQHIVFVDNETGELRERRLEHREQAEHFYRELQQRHQPCVWGWKRADTHAGSSIC